MQEVRSDERVQLLQGVWLFERCTESELAAIARDGEPPQRRTWPRAGHGGHAW